jgi:hypothetical protein
MSEGRRREGVDGQRRRMDREGGWTEKEDGRAVREEMRGRRPINIFPPSYPISVARS